MRKSQLFLSSALGATMLFSGATVQAQDDDEFALEEIIVTARYKEEDLSSTPMAITAMTADALERQNIRDVRDLMDQAPGVYFTNQGGPGLGQISMRGVSQAALVGDEANVATFIDGFYWSGRIAFEQFAEGLERIEVVRGPQSALYGRNAFSGAVNYITKKPNQEETEYGGSVTYGSHGKKSMGGYISTPLVDDMVSFRLDYTHDETGGTWKNGTNGERLNDANSEALRARLLIDPDSPFSLDYTFTWLDRDTSSQALYAIPANELDSGYRLDFITFQYAPVRATTAMHRPDSDLDLHPASGNQQETFRHTAKLEWDGENVISSLSIAYTKEEIHSIFDATYGLGGDVMMYIDPNSPFGFSFVDINGDFAPDKFEVLGGQPNQDREDFSGEIRFASKSDGKLHWQFGGFFTELKYDDKLLTGYDVDEATQAAIVQAATVNFPGVGPVFAGLLPGTWSCNPTGPAAWTGADPTCPPNPDLFGLPFPQMIAPWFGEDYLLQDKYFENQEYSIFASLDYDVSEKVGIAVEGRYTWEDRTMNDRFDVVGGSFTDASVGLLAKNFKYFTPRVIVDFQATDDAFYYASVAKGVKAGGVQPSQNVTTTFYDPESNWTYEVGTKMSLMDGRMNLTAAAYFIDWTDMQVRENIGLDNIVTNIGKAEIKGVEIETETLIGEGLRLKLAYTYQDGKIKEGTMSSVRGFCDYDHLDHELSPTAFPMPDFMLPAECLSGAETFTIPFGPDAGTYVTAIDLTTGNVAGNRLKNSPKSTFIAGLNYSRPLENDMDFVMGVNYNYRSSIYWDEANSSQSGATNLVSANIGVATDTWSLTAWGKNLLNDDTPISSIRNFNILGQYLNAVQHREKATYGVTLKASF